MRTTMKKQAKVTSKGQVTIPREVRRRLGVRAGDRLQFEEDGDGVRVTAVRKESPFAKWESGIPELGRGQKPSRSGCGICEANR
jgi:antitoxin PrlF